MQFLVLTSANGVSDDAVLLARDAVQGATPNRLSDLAVEIQFDDIEQLPVITGIDVNVVPAENRRKKLLIADMDSTMIPVECIDELADFAGVKDQVTEITEIAMRGDLDFNESIIARVALLKGLRETALQQCYEERIALNPGARTLVQTMNSVGAMTALVSGGFTYFTKKIAAEAGFQINQANTLCIENKTVTGKVGLPILGQQSKLDSLNAFCAQGGFTPADVIAAGDGANDRSMITAAGLGVAYKAKETLANAADARLYHSDLTALLSLQGIPQKEYVS